MCAKKKENSAAARERVVVLKSGQRLPLVGENDRYWLCRGTQFRKGGDQVARVEDLPEAVDETAAEGEAEEREAVEGDVREEGEEDADC